MDAAGEIVAVLPNGHPDVSARNECEIGGKDADDAMGLAVEKDGATYDAGTRAEAASPILMAEHDDEVAAGLVFVGVEGATDNRMNAEERKETRGCEGGLHATGITLAGEIETGGHVDVDGHFGKAAIVGLKVLEIAGRETELGPSRHVSVRDFDQTLRLEIRERPEKRGVDGAEDGGVGADAESQGQDGDGGEPWRLAQHAEGEAKVLQKVGEEIHAALDG
jgi:hypothetical protein